MSPRPTLSVMAAKAGIHSHSLAIVVLMDSGQRRNDEVRIDEARQ